MFPPPAGHLERSGGKRGISRRGRAVLKASLQGPACLPAGILDDIPVLQYARVRRCETPDRGRDREWQPWLVQINVLEVQA